MLPGVADVVTEVDVDAVFDDGTRLVVVVDGEPIGAEPAMSVSLNRLYFL